MTVTMRASRASGASSPSTWDSTPALPAPEALPALRARCAAPHPRQSRSADVTASNPAPGLDSTAAACASIASGATAPV